MAATLVLDRLTSGTYVGVDRSATMIAAATRRNAAAVAAGRASFVQASVEDVTMAPVDRVVAARVAALVRPPGLDAVWRLLVPGGRLLLAFDAPPGSSPASPVERAGVAVAGWGFVAVAAVERRFDGGLVTCVSAVRPPG